MPADQSLEPTAERIERFRRTLDSLVDPELPVAIAVSGGPDSLALLLLAVAARPGRIEAATVDHALRPEARDEAAMVAGICERLQVPHSTLTIEWQKKPETAVQELARVRRYALLGQWAGERGMAALLTAHHVDDQAETFVMRLLRGAGVTGLAGMRRRVKVPGSDVALVRPLLGWRRSELEEICRAAGLAPVDDPSNADDRFERARIRKALAEAKWLDREAVALSARHLAEADAALHWAAAQEWERAVSNGAGGITYCPTDAPREIRRRIARRAVLNLATEGGGAELRGRELDRLITALAKGGKTTLRGVLCSGGLEWRFVPAPKRTRPAAARR